MFILPCQLFMFLYVLYCYVYILFAVRLSKHLAISDKTIIVPIDCSMKCFKYLCFNLLTNKKYFILNSLTHNLNTKTKA